MSEAGDEGDDGRAGEQVVRAYYEAIDAGDYERFADLLAPGVVHERPDRTIEGRETLVGFMRDDRPQTDTSHKAEVVYRKVGGDGDDGGGDGRKYAVQGRLLDADGNPMFSFVDVFEVESDAENENGSIARIQTYTR